MFQWLTTIFDIRGFNPRWLCGAAWHDQPYWGWVHIVADIATWGAYVTILLVILAFVRRRRDVPFSKVFWLFGAFIFACGTGHLVEAMIFWWPAYRLSAVVKVLTAAVSWATVFCLVRVMPQALAFRSPRQLEQEVNERTRELKQMKDRLEAEILERHRITAELQASEGQLRLALQAGGMGTWDWDLATHRVRFNDMEKSLTAWDNNDAEIDADDFFERVHADDRPGVTQAVEAAIRLHQSYDQEFRFLLPSGETRWLGGRGEVIRDAAGNPLRMMGVNFDISRRKRDEQTLRLKTRAIECATNGIVITDALQPDHPIIFVNPAFVALTRYTEAEVIGKNCRLLQGPDTDRETTHEIRLALQEGRECAVTILNYRKDGTPFWNDLRIAPLLDEYGRVTHFVGIQSDVTERINAEYELFQAREAAEAANQAKTQFLASMSHEIRTPLTAVLGCADVLCRRITSGTDRELALVIRNQGQLLLRLLNDVLDLSKIEAGKLDLRVERCELRALVDEVQKLVAPLAAEKGIGLRAEVDQAVPATVMLDPLRIRQILLNLLSNSIKFTDSGHVELLVSRGPSSKRTELQFQICDTGVGIPAGRLKEVFNEFAQLETPRGERNPGTGLGLAIVRKLVELHGGKIAVNSAEGQGTTFRIELPVEEAPATAASQSATDLLATAPDLSPGRLKCNLLVAEDTRSLQFMLKRMLEDQLSSIHIVENGAEALEAVRQAEADGRPVDLVLMDMQMPVLNGFEATRLLRESGFLAAIIALTAGAMEGEREKCLAAGCTDYLPKPLDRDQLLRTLHKYSSSKLNHG